jgi:NitT/TauT family transport system substrate-binding protein
MVFRIQPHTRLHEWVADEAGFFRDEGLEYEFAPDRFAAGSAMTGTVSPAGEVPGQISSGAFEDMAKGRSSDVFQCLPWAVNAAAAAQHGRMYGKAPRCARRGSSCRRTRRAGSLPT